MQVLINLIKNSLKFTTKGFIHILSYYDFFDEMLIIHVRDSGNGIKLDDLNKLFTRFGKLETANSKLVNQEGIGLGLSICQAIIH